MSDFQHYLHMKDKTRAARAEWELASARLELAQIRERLAEIQSQHEPIASLECDDDLSPREEMFAAAHYVVIGRIPGGKK